VARATCAVHEDLELAVPGRHHIEVELWSHYAFVPLHSWRAAASLTTRNSESQSAPSVRSVVARLGKQEGQSLPSEPLEVAAKRGVLANTPYNLLVKSSGTVSRVPGLVIWSAGLT